MEENNLVQKEEKNPKNFLFSWIHDNYDRYFLLILAFAFILRVWIFTKTMNQPLWWDEADYLSAAKNIGLRLDIQDIWYYRRGFLFPLLSAPFFTLGLGEVGLRFMEVLFSTGLRVSELAALNRDTINLQRREFGIVGKGGRARVVFLSTRAVEFIQKYLNGKIC